MKGAIKKYRANPDFLLREVAGEAVLIPIGEAGVFENSVISLNDTCSFLWKLFQEPRTEEEDQKFYRRVCKVWIIKGGVK